MNYIYKIKDQEIYILGNENCLTSDFDSIQQLLDVGFEDPGTVTHNYSTNLHTVFKDLILLAEIQNLEDLPKLYPELMI